MRSHRFVIIGLVACSMLMHEILLTRVCALRLYFHFAFLVISSCLLGLGASGSLLATYQNTWKRAPRLWLGRFLHRLRLLARLCVRTRSPLSAAAIAGFCESGRPRCALPFQSGRRDAVRVRRRGGRHAAHLRRDGREPPLRRRSARRRRWLHRGAVPLATRRRRRRVRAHGGTRRRGVRGRRP